MLLIRDRSLGTRRHTRRPGFTLAELLVALTIFGIVMGGMMAVLRRQQRFYRSATDLMSMRGQLRQGEMVLPYDLRWISTADTLINTPSNKWYVDIYNRDDHTIEFRRMLGSSVVCGKKALAPIDTIILPPTTMSPLLTTWGSVPVIGDSLLILDEGISPSQVDDQWRAYGITAISQASGLTGCPFGLGNLLALTDTSGKSYRVTISPALSSTVVQNAPVRVFRRSRYQLYKASDNKWYLGFADCLSTYTTASGCSTMTPVAGPFLGYQNGNGTPDGLTFNYLDSTGTTVPTVGNGGKSSDIARIKVVVRGITRNVVDMSGQTLNAKQKIDSAVLSIAVRNRK